MSLCFKKNIVVVTGATRGIGWNIAATFAKNGAKVIAVGRDEQKAIEPTTRKKSNNIDVDFLCLDISQRTQAEIMVEQVTQKYGGIDVLVNNARTGVRTSPLKETESNFDSVVNVCLKAPLFASQMMIESNNQNRQGVILNISSVVSKHISNESASYHMAKSALENLTRYLAVHGGAKRIRANAVRPGFIVQDEHQERYWQDDNRDYRKVAEFCHPLKTVGCSDDIANAALFLCSDMAQYITGQVLTVDGGMSVQGQWDLLNQFLKQEMLL